MAIRSPVAVQLLFKFCTDVRVGQNKLNRFFFLYIVFFFSFTTYSITFENKTTNDIFETYFNTNQNLWLCLQLVFSIIVIAIYTNIIRLESFLVCSKAYIRIKVIGYRLYTILVSFSRKRHYVVKLTVFCEKDKYVYFKISWKVC